MPRSGHRYTGRSVCSKAHRRWLSAIKMAYPSRQIGLPEYINTLTDCSACIQRLTEQLQQLVRQWRMYPVVKALRSLRGVSLIVSATVMAEVGDLKRFANPSELMSYLGLVPSENSSGERIKRGSITKTGNNHVRCVLVEAAWAYRLPARISRVLLKRQEGLPKKVCEISWKAQVRLCSRYRHLWNKGKDKQVVVTAIARELCAFMWAIANEIEIPAAA